jgi:aspartate aminotransferase
VRIIGGEARGRALKTPANNSIRPTADKTREALFSFLQSAYRLPHQATVLDLFCGTGALGLEALSRGAKSAVFVDASKQAFLLTQDNIKQLGYEKQSRAFCSSAVDFLKKAKGTKFELVFVDPPYQQGLLDEVFSLLPQCLADGAVVIAEHATREAPPSTIDELALQQSRRYGAATLSIYQYQGGGSVVVGERGAHPQSAHTLSTTRQAVTSPLSTRAKSLKPSPTLAMSARAKALIRQGIDIVDFSLGEPDFTTPAHIREAAKRALDQGHTKYTEVPGILPLREKIAARAEKELGLPFVASEVVVGVGAKQLLFHAALALLDPGDEVVIIAPYWVSYPNHAEFAGAKAVIVSSSLEEGFVPPIEKIEAAFSDKTKLLIINSPSNPTGATFDLQRLRAIAELVRWHPRCWVISDEIYNAIYFGAGRAPSILHAAPDLRDRTIIVDGASKAYAMTGWRLGWCVAPQVVSSAISALQSQSTSNATSFAQYGLLAALEGDQTFVEEMCQEFFARRDLFAAQLSQISGLKYALPTGAFYFLVDVGQYLSAPILADYGEGSLGLATYLLEKAQVAVVPGSAFGAEGFVRFSYALSRERITEGLARFRTGLTSLLAEIPE